ncbi:MAG: exodeoxyribonuclease VII small subunit [Gemmatimonadaceae bacterium]|nr:exodeoxyribonuclease VII small subunit [Gemmatimonadaceae bacterium]
MTDPGTPDADVRVEATLARLEAIVRDLERDDLPLDDALQLFEEGVTHVRAATASLQRAEARVGQLVEATDGALSVTPLDA